MSTGAGSRKPTRCTPAASSAVLTQALAFVLYLLVRPDRGALFQEHQGSGVSSGSAAIRAGQENPLPTRTDAVGPDLEPHGLSAACVKLVPAPAGCRRNMATAPCSQQEAANAKH